MLVNFWILLIKPIEPKVLRLIRLTDQLTEILSFADGCFPKTRQPHVTTSFYVTDARDHEPLCNRRKFFYLPFNKRIFSRKIFWFVRKVKVQSRSLTLGQVVTNINEVRLRLLRYSIYKFSISAPSEELMIIRQYWKVGYNSFALQIFSVTKLHKLLTRIHFIIWSDFLFPCKQKILYFM